MRLPIGLTSRSPEKRLVGLCLTRRDPGQQPRTYIPCFGNGAHRLKRLCDPYGGGGMPDLVGLCTLLQAAQGHCPHRYERRTAACGMRARRRGAVLVLQVIIVDTRGLMSCIDFGEPDGRAERYRARGLASACIPVRSASRIPPDSRFRSTSHHPAQRRWYQRGVGQPRPKGLGGGAGKA